MASKTISFQSTAWLLRNLTARDPKGSAAPGATAKANLERWFLLLHETLLGVTLEAAEILLLAEIVEEWRATASSMAILVDVLPGSIRENTAPGYGHVRAELADRATAWTILERWAVVDYMERFVVEEQLRGGALPDVVRRLEKAVEGS